MSKYWDDCFILGNSNTVNKANEAIKILILESSGYGLSAIVANQKLTQIKALSNDDKIRIANQSFGS